MKRFLATAFLIIATSLCLPAKGNKKAHADSIWINSPIVTLDPGKKVMNVADLDLGENVTLGELLQMFPEVATREDDELLKNFDLQIDDVSSGSSKEILMTQYKASDIKTIEFSVNPTASSQIDGQGGVINLILNDPQEDFHGTVTLEASSTWDANPAFKFAYQKNRLKLAGMVSAEYYQPRDNRSSVSTINSRTDDRIYVDSSDDYKYGIQFADIHMEYAFTDKNRLKAWFWESYSKEGHYIKGETDSCGSIYDDNLNRTIDELSIYAGLNYKHDFGLAIFETELSYKYMPGAGYKCQERDESVVEDFQENYYPQELNFLAKGKFKLIKETLHHKCNMTVGLNTSMSPNLYTYTDAFDVQTLQQQQVTLEARSNDLYVSPYVEVDSKIGPVFLKGGIRYQFYQYDIISAKHEEFKKPQSKVTGFLNFGWQIVPHHHLSLILDKSIKRPDNQQIYPFTFYDPESGLKTKGNPNLNAEDIYTASIDYQYDFSNNGTTVLAGAGIRYNHVDAVIASLKDDQLIEFSNTGYCDVISTTLMGMYGYGPFKVFLTGNLLQNWSCIPTKSDSNFSYNITLTPMLSFKDDWRISGMLEYNSSVTTVFKQLGQYFYSEMRLSKGIKNWTVYGKLTDNFHRIVEDIERVSPDVTTITLHYLHFPGLVIGANWNF